MTIEYLKKATPPQEAIDGATAETVQRLLADIQTNGREAVEKYARDLDGWRGSIVVGEADLSKASNSLAQGVKDDIAFAHARVKDFAQRQRDSLYEFEAELIEGLITGQKLIPVNTAGCYVPGGRYAHAASAIMSICTAKAARVSNIVATSPGHNESGVNPAILHTMKLCGADTVLSLGGVQGVAAMAFGLYSPRPADVIVGPGNSFVAEAKRALFGRVGIDVLAGPTESAIIADETADVSMAAADLAGQAEHGPDSPVWLFTSSRELGLKVIELMPSVIAALPELARTAASAAWRDYGEVVLVSSREEMIEIRDQYAPEHLQVFAHDLDWWLVAGQADQLRLAFPGRGDDRSLWRQVRRPQPHLANPGCGEVLGRVERGQVHQDRDLPAIDPRRQPRGGPGGSPYLAPGRHGRSRAHGRYPAKKIFSARVI
jgi:sulfopropanediol 3-dehydrogenase